MRSADLSNRHERPAGGQDELRDSEQCREQTGSESTKGGGGVEERICHHLNVHLKESFDTA